MTQPAPEMLRNEFRAPSAAPGALSLPHRSLFPGKGAAWSAIFAGKRASEGAGIAIEAARNAPEVAKECDLGGKDCDPSGKECIQRGLECNQSDKEWTRSGLECSRSGKECGPSRSYLREKAEKGADSRKWHRSNAFFFNQSDLEAELNQSPILKGHS